MIGEKIQCIVVGIKNRIRLVEERGSVGSSKFVLGLVHILGLVGSEEDKALRHYLLDKICHGILLVAIDNIIIVIFSVIVNHFFNSHNIPTIKRFAMRSRNVSPGTLILASGRV